MSKFLNGLYARMTSLRDDKGATAVEYVLLVGGIAALIVGAVSIFGAELRDGITNIIP